MSQYKGDGGEKLLSECGDHTCNYEIRKKTCLGKNGTVLCNIDQEN